MCLSMIRIVPVRGGSVRGGGEGYPRNVDSIKGSRNAKFSDGNLERSSRVVNRGNFAGKSNNRTTV